MKVKYIGETDLVYMIKDKIYDVLSIEKGWYRIIDEEEEDYLYPPELFEIVENKKIVHANNYIGVLFVWKKEN